MVVLIGSYLNVDVFGTIFFVFFWLPLKSMLTLLTPITFIQIFAVMYMFFPVYDDGPYPYEEPIGDWYFSSPVYSE